VLEKYPQDVKLVKKLYPLNFHKMAKPAAIAALAAGEEGKFWEYNEKLFENFKKLNHQKFLDLAVEIGLDLEAFKKNLTDPKHQQAISKHKQDGRKAGVSGTPTIFINGRRLGDRSLKGFSTLIDSELKKIQK
jgi:protein-disulfide isomerase